MSATMGAANPLFAVRDCLRQRQLASAEEIAACVHVPVAVAHDMLAHWVRRGLIERLDAHGATCSTGACARCGACGSGRAAAVLYRWRVEPPAAARPALLLRIA